MSTTPLEASRQSSVFLANLHHAYAQTDGTYAFPNSREGDLLKQAKSELEQALADSHRIDWLERKQGDVAWTGLRHRDPKNEAVAGHPGMTRARADTVREAIDRAMRREP